MNEEEKLLRVVTLARDSGDTALELKALKRIKELRAQPIQAKGLEAAKVMASGAAADIASGYAGLAGAILPGEEGQGAEWAAKTKEAIQIQPKTEQTRQELQAVGELPVIKQIGQATEAYKGYVQGQTERMGEGGSSPLTQTIVETAALGGPAAVATALGAKGGEVIVKKAPAELAKDFKYAKESVIRNITNKPDLRVYTDESATMLTPEAIDTLKGLYDKRINESPELPLKIKEMNDSGVNPADIDKFIQEQLKMTGVLTPQQAERFNIFGEVGVTPLKADITQSIDDFRAVQDAQKYSGKIADVRSQQETQLTRAAERARDITGGTAQPDGGAGFTSAKVFGVMDNVVQRYDDAINSAYTLAKETSGKDKSIKVDSLSKSIRQNMHADEFSGRVPSTIRGYLQDLGVLGKGFEVQGRIDVNTAEKVRQRLNELYKTANPEGRKMIADMKEAIDLDVESKVGTDIFKDARQAKIDYHKLIERDKAKRDKTKSSFVEKIIYEQIPPEQIIGKLKTARYPDKIKLKKFLTEDAGDSGKAAWDDMRAQIVQDAIEKALSHSGKAEGGVKKFQGKVFKNNVYNTISTGDNRQIDLFFNKSEQRLIDNIAEVFEARLPQQQVYVGSGVTAPAVEKAMSMMGNVGEVAKGAKGLYGYLLNRGKISEQIEPFKQTQKEIAREL